MFSTDRSTTDRSTDVPSLNSQEFDQILDENSIDITGRGLDPVNRGDLDLILAKPRQHLSLSTFSEKEFKAFRELHKRTLNEAGYIRTVFPVIQGTQKIFSGTEIPFRNLSHLTGALLPKPSPTFYDGEERETLDFDIRKELDSYVIPTKSVDAPIVPNFFTEIVSTRGILEKARRNACYAGVFGARCMQRLKSFGQNSAFNYDGEAYTIACAVQDGIVEIITIHQTPSEASGRDVEYHTAQFGRWDLTSSREQYIKGVTAYQNAREWASSQRKTFVEIANKRAREIANKKAMITANKRARESENEREIEEQRSGKRSMASIDSGSFSLPARRRIRGLDLSFRKTRSVTENLSSTQTALETGSTGSNVSYFDWA